MKSVSLLMYNLVRDEMIDTLEETLSYEELRTNVWNQVNSRIRVRIHNQVYNQVYDQITNRLWYDVRKMNKTQSI